MSHGAIFRATCNAMDHSAIKQTSELGKFISTAGKSIINLVNCEIWLKNIVKMWKIQSCEVCDFCTDTFVLRVEKRYHILRYFSTKLRNFTKFMMLFPAVLMNFPNSEVFLIGEWPILHLRDHQ